MVVRRADGGFTMVSAEMYADPKWVAMRIGVYSSDDTSLQWAFYTVEAGGWASGFRAAIDRSCSWHWRGERCPRREATAESHALVWGAGGIQFFGRGRWYRVGRDSIGTMRHTRHGSSHTTRVRCTSMRWTPTGPQNLRRARRPKPCHYQDPRECVCTPRALESPENVYGSRASRDVRGSRAVSSTMP